ncbi:hypothetical protein [Baekduia sp. Peel2402]|uniref:hypothetical protein n=1 Tax=Baekduia sp. Peel2402 TaxID=3458296 RepID=UPI00403ECB83
MSTQQRNHACLVAVDPSTADVLRHQTLVVLEANHYFFEELPQFSPEAQHALSVIYRDAFAVLDAIGWSPDASAGPVDVPLTDGHIDQLRRCRFDLGVTNINRLDLLDAATTEEQAASIRAAIDADRTAAQTLDLQGERQRSPIHGRSGSRSDRDRPTKPPDLPCPAAHR